MDFLARFLVPGAAVFARGFTDLPLWARLASQLSATPLPLPPSTEAAAAALAEWQQTLAGYSDGGKEAPEVVAVNAAATVVVGRYTRTAWARAFKPGRFIVLAPSAEVSILVSIDLIRWG